MSQTKLELWVFQETKVTDGIHTHISSVYCVFVADVPSRTCRGLAIFYRDVPHFQVKSFHPQRPNVTSIHLDSDGSKCFIDRCYLFPDNASTIESIIVAIGQRPHGSALLVASDFNVYLVVPEVNRCTDDITAAIATAGLEEISMQVLPCQKS